MIKNTFFILIGVFFSSILLGCGQAGNLYLPEQSAAREKNPPPSVQPSDSNAAKQLL